jgi:hypothetical protein
MRARSARFLVLVVTLLLPVLLRAQFIPPTPEELKMTDDPKSPGAAAVYLNYSEDDNDPMHYQAIYARIKILTEKGKELSVVNLPFLSNDFKITDIKARTIHADGTVIPLEVKPEELLSSKTTDKTISHKVFTLPKVEVGSIIEYRYEIRYDDDRVSSPMWEIQREYFVHKAHYSFIPFPNFQPGSRAQTTSRYIADSKGRVANSLIWWMNLPKGVTIKTDVGGHYAVDLEDVPAIPDEPWMPPIRSVLYKVFFYYMPSFTAQEFWMDSAKDWVKENEHFAEVSSGLREAVSQIVSPTDPDLEKARKIYKAVQALDNTDYSRKKSESEMKALKIKEAKHAEDVWKQKSGDSEDIALLYLAMLRAAGLKAYAVKVVDRDRGVFDPSFMSLGQLDDTLVDLQIGTELNLLDPGERMCPFRTVSWRHSGVRGLAENDAGPSIVTLPEQGYKDNLTNRRAMLTLDAHGGITGTLQYTLTGQEALRWRQEALRNDVEELKKRFDRMLESDVPQGVEAHVDHFLALDNPDANLIAMIKVQGKLGTATAKRLLLPGQFFEARGQQPFVDQPHREQPVDMQYGLQEADQVDYTLPAGYTVEGGPQVANISWTGHAVYIVKTASQQPGSFTVARRLARAFSQVKPGEYQDLRGFYQKVAAADQQQIVLAAPVQGGN